MEASIRKHRDLGPGLLESVYEAVLAHALEQRGFRVERQNPPNRVGDFGEDENLER